MKKFFLTMAFAVSALAINAQGFVGGEVGMWRDWHANSTEFTLAPEVGYSLSDKFAIGVALNFNHFYNDGLKVNGFGVNPYARYSFAKLGPVSLFADGEFAFGTFKVKDGGDAMNSWEIGIKPGAALTLTKHLSFVTHVGFLGYRDADDGIRDMVDTGLGFRLSGYDLTFGLYYNF